MTTDQPNNAADMPVKPSDADTAAAVLSDGGKDDMPGGGGLGGQAGGRPSGQGGATPNSPIDVATPGGAEAGTPEREAQRRSLEDGGVEEHPTSR